MKWNFKNVRNRGFCWRKMKKMFATSMQIIKGKDAHQFVKFICLCTDTKHSINVGISSQLLFSAHKILLQLLDLFSKCLQQLEPHLYFTILWFCIGSLTQHHLNSPSCGQPHSVWIGELSALPHWATPYHPLSSLSLSNLSTPTSQTLLQIPPTCTSIFQQPGFESVQHCDVLHVSIRMPATNNSMTLILKCLKTYLFPLQSIHSGSVYECSSRRGAMQMFCYITLSIFLNKSTKIMQETNINIKHIPTAQFWSLNT